MVATTRPFSIIASPRLTWLLLFLHSALGLGTIFHYLAHRPPPSPRNNPSLDLLAPPPRNITALDRALREEREILEILARYSTVEDLMERGALSATEAESFLFFRKQQGTPREFSELKSLRGFERGRPDRCELATVVARYRGIAINRAGVGELHALPGMNSSTAEAIIAYRAEHGPFLVPSDLAKIQGIGEGKIKKWINIINFN